MPRPEYEVEKRLLQIELLKLQNWVKDDGPRVVDPLRGTGRRGQGRHHQAVHWSTSTREGPTWSPWRSRPTRSRPSGTSSATSPTCPSAGEIVLFDRSWYNRAGVERVMGYCTDEQYQLFIAAGPQFEKMLVDDGISV